MIDGYLLPDYQRTVSAFLSLRYSKQNMNCMRNVAKKLSERPPTLPDAVLQDRMRHPLIIPAINRIDRIHDLCACQAAIEA